jgi:L-asparaginase
MKVVYVLATGGTTEKIYSEPTGSVENVDSKIDRYLRLLRLPETEVNVVPLMNKDSLEMTDQDRVLVLGMVRAILKEKAPIVITHGTDAMVQTGLYLERGFWPWCLWCLFWGEIGAIYAQRLKQFKQARS